MNTHLSTPAPRARRHCVAAGLTLALLLGASLAQAATITVLNNADSGAGSLRAAIAAAAAAGDTIVFDAALNGQTIVLTSGALAIGKNLTITGPGADKLAVSGNNASLVFLVQPGAVANLAGLTVRNGFGGIYNSGGTVTVANSTISGNQATFGTGGGIYGNGGTMTVANSTVSGNQASFAGGIYNGGGGNLTVANSTITGNRGTSGQGGLVAFSTETLNNSIVAGNFTGAGSTPSDIGDGTVNTASHNLIGDAGSAGGIVNGVNGNIVGAAIATVLNPTLANNGGPTFTHALLSGSPALDAGDNAGAAGLSFDQRGAGFPRIFNTTVDIGAFENGCSTITATASGGGAICAGGSSTVTVTVTGGTGPYTITLDNSGGTQSGSSPLTFTVSPGSTTTYQVASGTDANSCAVTPAGSAVVTVSAPTVFVATTGSDANDGTTLALAKLTIQAGINAACPGGTVFVKAGTYNPTASLSVGKNLSIVGDGASTTIVSGSANGGNTVFYISSGTVLLSGLTVRDGTGGGIFNGGTLTVANCTISGNQTTSEGGGINNAGTLTVANSTISGNQSSRSGGGIFNNVNRTLTVANSTISGNRGTDRTGGLVALSTETLNNTIVAGNFTGVGSTPSDIGFGAVETASHNLIGDAGSAGGIVNGVNGNIVGVAIATVLNPTLANNGGPTLTHALVAGSPVLNAGDNTLIPADFADQDGDSNTAEPSPDDQRGPGFARTSNTTVDIGAFENGCPAITATASGGGAICAGNNATVTVTVSGGTGPYTITLDNSGGTQTGPSPISFTVSPGSTTTYQVASGTAANSCAVTPAGSATVTVSAPTVFVATTGSDANSGTTLALAKLTIQAGIEAACTVGTVKVAAGAYAGNVDAATPAKDITLAAGDSPGQVTINGNLTLNAGDTLPIEINGTSAASQFDNFIVNGTVVLGGATLNATLGFTPAVADSFTIIANDAADPVTGIFNGLPQGAVFTVGPTNLQITYQGGTGNDVVLTAIAPANPVYGGTPGDDVWLVKLNGANVEIWLNGVLIDSRPYASLTSLAISGLAGSDALTIDFSGGNPIPPDGLNYDGGGGAGSDSLHLVGGSFASGSYTPGAPGAGLFAYAGVGPINFTGLEPVDDLVAVGTFTIAGTAGADTINLINGPVVLGTQTLQVNSPSFELVNFANKTAVIVHGLDGADTFNLNATTPAAGLASLTLNGQGSGADDGAIDTFNFNSTLAGVPVSANGDGARTYSSLPTASRSRAARSMAARAPMSLITAPTPRRPR